MDLNQPPTSQNLCSTAILDYETPSFRDAIHAVLKNKTTPREFLQNAHAWISTRIRPVYTLNEFQPVSVSLSRGSGSCSQRIACLEAIARSHSIGTRVRAIWIQGQFWAPRFFWTRLFIPQKILLAWPQFWIDDRWVDLDEIYGSAIELASVSKKGFTNSAETLFEAVALTPVDLFGKTHGCGIACLNGRFDLSPYVLEDGGFFDSRDGLFGTMPVLQETVRGILFEFIFGGRKVI